MPQAGNHGSKPKQMNNEKPEGGGFFVKERVLFSEKSDKSMKILSPINSCPPV